MQFGRLTGAGIAVLGMFLLFLQFVFFLNAGRAERHPLNAHSEFNRPDHSDRRSHRFTALPGILGGILLLGGIAIFFLARIEDEPDQKHAVK